MRRNRLLLVELESILTGFENVLNLNIREPIDVQISQAMDALGNHWGIEGVSGRSVFELMTENPMSRQKIEHTILQLLDGCKNLSYLTNINIFHSVWGDSLLDVNSLGFDRNRLEASLQYLMKSQLYHNKDQFFDSILAAASNIEVCNSRRLVTIMGVFDKMGFLEGAAVVAQYLYIGMKIG